MIEYRTDEQGILNVEVAYFSFIIRNSLFICSIFKKKGASYKAPVTYINADLKYAPVSFYLILILVRHRSVCQLSARL